MIYFLESMLFRFPVVQGLGDLHERTYIEAQMQRILEPWRKGRKIVAGRSICQAVVLEWNPGGHFADSGKRLAKESSG